MPYIKDERRDGLAPMVDESGENAGELNYQITQLCLYYLARHGERYKTYNDILGALEGAKLELYRRRIAPYEDTKIAENGDVY